MREIKFRAWDRNNRQWVDPALVAIIGNGAVLLYRDGRWSVTYEDIEPSRFTGLHDKNGKEVYEGDTVRNWEEKVGPIEWGTDGWVVRETDQTTFKLASFLYPREGEVISNICENPELINTPKED